MKSKVIKTLAGKYEGERHHSWRLWKALDGYVKATFTAFQLSLHDLKELCANICDESEILSGEVFLQELLVGSKT